MAWNWVTLYTREFTFLEVPLLALTQNAAQFRETIREIEIFYPKNTLDKTYGARSKHSVRASFEELSANLQKFRFALRFFHLPNCKGVAKGSWFQFR